MPIKLSPVINFPKGFPRAITGTLLPEGNVLITGHEDGLVVQWNMETGNYEILHECHSSVMTMSISPRNDVLVGCHSGLLFVFSLREPSRKYTIQEATFSKYSRVWRATWLNENDFIMTSTFGVINLFHRTEPNGWEKRPFEGHSHSIFGLGSSNSRFVASGDYQGNILVWRLKEGGYERVDRLKIQTGVQGISWHKDRTFAAIDRIGNIHVFEFEPDKEQWRSVFETATATSSGSVIAITRDRKTILAGTDTEVIQFDLDSQQMLQIKQSGIKALFPVDDIIFVLTDHGLFTFTREKIKVPAKFVKYRYAKVSLVGHTGTGKTTLCSMIVNKSAEGIESTFGKKVWILEFVPETASSKNRIIFHDHGGQDTVLGTFLPFLTDSDIILIFFKQTDNSTFEKAIEILHELDSIVSKRTKTFFVRTYIDHRMNVIDEDKIQEFIDSGRIIACLKTSPKEGRGIKELTTQVMQEVSWETAKIMIESPYVEGITKAVSELQESNAKVVPLDEVRNRFEKITNFPISKGHAKFLLRNLSTQGVVEYYPEIFDSIIINDEQYNELKTRIPTLVKRKNGIISIKEIIAEFGDQPYVHIIDKIYSTYGISVENRDLRIFPEKLRSGSIPIPKPYRALLVSSSREEHTFADQDVKISRLIEALSEQNLGCIDASQTEGLFSWERNACVYYSFQKTGDGMRGFFVKFTYYIGGQNETIRERLANEFSTIIDRLYGPTVSEPEVLKKKKPGNLNIK